LKRVIDFFISERNTEVNAVCVGRKGGFGGPKPPTTLDKRLGKGQGVRGTLVPRSRGP